MAKPRTQGPPRPRHEAASRPAGSARALRIRIAVAVAAAVAALAIVFALSSGGGSGGSSKGIRKYAYDVGTPGPGQPAPEVRLPSTGGGRFDLSAQRGKTVMLYFQEGLTCQPCWDQLKDLDAQMAKVKALGIDEVVSVTSDPLGALRQKASDEGLSSPVLSDPKLAVSSAYHANQYGMMGTSRDGHSFVIVGPDGRIRFRADYGGAPDYTMFVPVPSLLADIRSGLRGQA
jgi:peroxiredoxin